MAKGKGTGWKRNSLGLKTQRTAREREVKFSFFYARVSKIGSGREQQLDNAISMIDGTGRESISDTPIFFLDPSQVACVVTCEYNLWRVEFCKHRLLCVYLGFEGNKLCTKTRATFGILLLSPLHNNNNNREWWCVKFSWQSAETFAFWDGAVAAAVVAVAVAPFHRRRVAAAAGFFHGGGVAVVAALFHVGSVATDAVRLVCHLHFFLVDCCLAVFFPRDVRPDPGHHEPLALVRLAELLETRRVRQEANDSAAAS